MQDELTAKMHSEFMVSPETEIKQRAGCVWTMAGKNATKEDIEKYASMYAVSFEDCMKWKKHWTSLMD